MTIELSNYSRNVVAANGIPGLAGNMVIVRKKPTNVWREEKAQRQGR